MPTYDVIVVGAGHAGCEAAAAAARLGCRTALVTLRLDHIARLSCNPAIGGLAKGHLVRELDALGGLMGRVADASSIQFRRLNTRKGLAVQSSRAQVDIDVYPARMRELLARIEGLDLVEAEVSAVMVHGGRVTGVTLGDGTVCEAPAVVLTTGTFLSAVMHTGTERAVGGRVGDESAHALSDSLGQLGIRLGRLKTGTVPRLDGRTIHWARMEEQRDTVPDGRFGFGPRPPQLPQITCHMTYTNERTHDIIRSGLDRSPLFTGVIEGTGPRYCPSIEDKVVRFEGRDRHLLFIEPEGLNTHRVYPNGLSTSLPADIQVEIVRSVVGLEDAVIVQPGYAVEYDFADPRDLGSDLQHREVRGLFMAGQVNGTSGYEEAAVQGFVAGVSAARGEPFVLGRDQAYIGVLVDDLVTRGVGGEPYRMFTSRAEHRLLLREDNADRRLMPVGRELGLVDDRTWSAFEARAAAIEQAHAQLASTRVAPTPAVCGKLRDEGLGTLRKPVTVAELLRRPEASYASVQRVAGLPGAEPEVAEQVEIDVKYAGYIERARQRAEQARKLDDRRLPSGIDWRAVTALSSEVRERLERHRPETVGQLGRLPGVTPAAVNVVVALLAKGSLG